MGEAEPHLPTLRQRVELGLTLTAVIMLILLLILAKLRRKTRYLLWIAALIVMSAAGLFLLRTFPASVQFEALVVALGGVALWLSRPLPVK